MNYNIEFYGYKNYQNEDITKRFISDSTYLDNEWNDCRSGELAKRLEKSGLITDMFLSFRVLKEDNKNLFDKLAKGKRIKLNGFDVDCTADLYFEDFYEFETMSDMESMKKAVSEDTAEICLHTWIRYGDPLFDAVKRGEDLKILTY